MNRLILVLIPFLGLVACRSHKEAAVPSERIVTQIERITEVRLDTAFIEVPAQSSEKLTTDTASHLETDFATSDARINPDGTLYHNLNNKPGRKLAIVPTTVQRIDSIVERKVPVYMDKPPNKADQFKIDVFWWLIGVIAALMAITFRKPIFGLITRIIK